MSGFTLTPAYVFARIIGSTVYFLRPSEHDLFKPGRPFAKLTRAARPYAFRRKAFRTVKLGEHEYQVLWLDRRNDKIDQEERDRLRRLLGRT